MSRLLEPHRLTTERTNILAALQYAADHRLDHHTIPLAHACRFLGSAGSPDQAIDAYSTGLIAASRAGNRAQEAILLLGRGETASNLERWDQADVDLGRAATLAQQLNDPSLEAYGLNDRGLLLLRQGRFEEAVRWLDLALPLSRRLDSRRCEAVVEGNLSVAHLGLGRNQVALEHAERGLRLRRQVGAHGGESAALTHVACVWRQLGRHETAITLCRKAISLGHSTPLNRNETIAEPLDVLATCLDQLGHTDDAITRWQEAAAIYDDTGYPHKAAEARQRLHDARPES